MSQPNSSAVVLHATSASVLGRRYGTPELPGQPHLQRRRGVVPPDPSKPPRQTLYHLNRSDIPPEAGGFKVKYLLY